MIEVAISKHQIQRAEQRYSFDILKGSRTNGKGNIYGAMGEILFLDYFKDREIDPRDTYDYDMIIDGYKIDVKTKHTTVKPLPHYNCSVFDYNTHQKCDFYFFSRVIKDLSKGYLLGYMPKREFYEVATFAKKGELDRGKPFRDDCYNVPISKIYRFSK